jgi:hypothetical protein
MPFPKTLDELRAAGYKFEGHSRCACGVVIEWWITPNQKRMPMDVTDSGKAAAHWGTCPKAGNFKRPRA